MYYPLVGEQVWISFCRDEVEDLRLDHATRTVTVAERHTVEPFGNEVKVRHLPSQRKLDIAQEGTLDRDGVSALVRSSHACTLQSLRDIFEMRELIRATRVAIVKSQALVLESDRAIARWQSNCERNQDGV